jgi:hypothetical protein
MLILSKYKDYYDYLTGIYGVDNNLVLDRRVFHNYELFEDEKIVFIICGKRYEGYYVKKLNKVLYGEELLQLGEKRDRRHSFAWGEYADVPNVLIKTEKIGHFGIRRRFLSDYVNVALEPFYDKLKMNEKENCPILYVYSSNDYYHYPQLSKYNFGSFIPAEDMYKILTEYLSNERTKLETHADTRTDVDKLLSKGFDKKTSFRKL